MVKGWAIFLPMITRCRQKRRSGQQALVLVSGMANKKQQGTYGTVLQSLPTQVSTMTALETSHLFLL